MKKLLAKATALYKRGRYERAMVIAKKILAIERNNETALFYVAHGLYFARQFRRSLQYWKRLKKLSPDEHVIHLNMGACYDDLRENTKAIWYYKKELELNQACGKALYNLGNLYYYAYKYKLAAGYLERCYSQNHSVDACICKLAHSYFKTGQHEKERLLYEDYLLTHPNDTWALNNLGSHLMGLGEYNRALLRLIKAARLDPNDHIVQRNIRKARRSLDKQRKDATLASATEVQVSVTT